MAISHVASSPMAAPRSQDAVPLTQQSDMPPRGWCDLKKLLSPNEDVNEPAESRSCHEKRAQDAPGQLLHRLLLCATNGTNKCNKAALPTLARRNTTGPDLDCPHPPKPSSSSAPCSTSSTPCPTPTPSCESKMPCPCSSSTPTPTSTCSNKKCNKCLTRPYSTPSSSMTARPTF